MSIKLGLRRQGRKGRPFYSIVAMDTQQPSDAELLDDLGRYDPGASPAVIEIDHDKTLLWLGKGAKPTATVNAILQSTGVTFKYALILQGKSRKDVNRIFSRWLKEKSAKIGANLIPVDEIIAESVKKEGEKETELVSTNHPLDSEAVPVRHETQNSNGLKTKTTNLTKRILVDRSTKAIRKAYAETMDIMGYVVIAEDGWIIKKFKDGTIEKISKLENRTGPIVLD